MSTITVTRPESAAEERYYVATQWQLIRRRFMAHRLALLGIVVLVALYAGALFAEFVAPYDGFRRFADYQLAAPQRVRLFHDGKPVLRPFVYGLHRERHPETRAMDWVADKSETASCSCSGPTTWAATCSPATCTRRASR